MNPCHAHLRSACVLLALAGAPFCAAAQRAQPGSTQPSPNAVMRSGVDFRSAGWLADRKVVNDSGEDIASVSDLILDRGSGRIQHVVIKTGATLGLGGKAIALPYGAFRWNGTDDKLLLSSSVEQLKTYPEFSAEEWNATADAGREVSDTERKMSPEAGDPYHGGIDTARKSRVEGEVKSVERIRSSAFGEQVIITVAPADGSTQRIALGPSWFVGGGAITPMRGDHVVVESFALPRDPEHLTAATVVRVGDRELRLRDTSGNPVWTVKSVQSGGREYNTAFWRTVLLTRMRGMKVDCRGEDCGKVNDVIIDRRSGEVGLLSIDPNKNFLGIADTKRLVPWSVATIALDGTVRIDASREMVLASPETPTNLSTLNSGGRAEAVYDAYQVPAPRFEPPNPVPPAASVPPDPWAAKGPVIAAIDRGSARTISGKVAGTEEVKFDSGIPSARAVRIKSGESDELVILGPARYIDHQNINCSSGDPATAEVVRTTINSKSYWLARSLDTKGNRFVLLQAGNEPVWDRR